MRRPAVAKPTREANPYITVAAYTTNSRRSGVTDKLPFICHSQHG
jgi:hypothetical protein